MIAPQNPESKALSPAEVRLATDGDCPGAYRVIVDVGGQDGQPLGRAYIDLPREPDPDALRRETAPLVIEMQRTYDALTA